MISWFFKFAFKFNLYPYNTAYITRVCALKEFNVHSASAGGAAFDEVGAVQLESS
jgi:hypothetical protein